MVILLSAAASDDEIAKSKEADEAKYEKQVRHGEKSHRRFVGIAWVRRG